MKPLLLASSVILVFAGCSGGSGSNGVAGPCGASGEACCSNSTCNSGLACTSGSCQALPGYDTLTVSVNGSGSGNVTSSDGQIACPSTCSETVASGTNITLTETPGPNSAFAGWSGACSGTGPCTVTVSGAESVTATFTTGTVEPTYTLTVDISGAGSGTVTGGSINCTTGSASGCSETAASGAQITLTANAASGSTFEGWSGAGCSGTGPCTVSMTQDESVTANFITTPTYFVRLNVAGLAGSGLQVTDGTNTISVPDPGAAAFPTTLSPGATYSVTVVSQPHGQTCTVTNGQGTITNSSVVVGISCAFNMTLSCPIYLSYGTLYNPDQLGVAESAFTLSNTYAGAASTFTITWEAASSAVPAYSGQHTGALALALVAYPNLFEATGDLTSQLLNGTGYVLGKISGASVNFQAGPGRYLLNEIYVGANGTSSPNEQATATNPPAGQYCLVIALTDTGSWCPYNVFGFAGCIVAAQQLQMGTPTGSVVFTCGPNSPLPCACNPGELCATP